MTLFGDVDPPDPPPWYPHIITKKPAEILSLIRGWPILVGGHFFDRFVATVTSPRMVRRLILCRPSSQKCGRDTTSSPVALSATQALDTIAMAALVCSLDFNHQLQRSCVMLLQNVVLTTTKGSSTCFTALSHSSFRHHPQLLSFQCKQGNPHPHHFLFCSSPESR